MRKQNEEGFDRFMKQVMKVTCEKLNILNIMPWDPDVSIATNPNIHQLLIVDSRSKGDVRNIHVTLFLTVQLFRIRKHLSP